MIIIYTGTEREDFSFAQVQVQEVLSAHLYGRVWSQTWRKTRIMGQQPCNCHLWQLSTFGVTIQYFSDLNTLLENNFYFVAKLDRNNPRQIPWYPCNMGWNFVLTKVPKHNLSRSKCNYHILFLFCNDFLTNASTVNVHTMMRGSKLPGVHLATSRIIKIIKSRAVSSFFPGVMFRNHNK